MEKPHREAGVVTVVVPPTLVDGVVVVWCHREVMWKGVGAGFAMTRGGGVLRLRARRRRRADAMSRSRLKHITPKILSTAVP